jgi:antitoxin component YwqK of YwqJK toxin-antitoxin module
MKRVPHSVLDYNEDDGLYYHDGLPFTGVSYTVGGNARLEGEAEYRDGVVWGLARSWHPSGLPASEAHCARGVWDGIRREWNESGRLRLEEAYEKGVCLCRKRWDEQGSLVEDYRLRESDPDFETLKLAREWASNMEQPESAAPRPSGGNNEGAEK